MNEFRRILKDHNVVVQDIEVARRFNAGTPLSKTTLTLLISSSVADDNTSTWTPAIIALRKYVEEQDLTLAVEIIDARIVQGIFTLPILVTNALTSFIAEKKHCIVKILNDCGAEWSSLEFWYRGLGNKKGECKATVLVGVPEPNLEVWRDIVGKIQGEVGARLKVEICFRVLGKVQYGIRV
jgi:hypothetical protein